MSLVRKHNETPLPDGGVFHLLAGNYIHSHSRVIIFSPINSGFF